MMPQPRRDRDITHPHMIIPRSSRGNSVQRATMYALTCPVLESTSIYLDFCLIDVVQFQYAVDLIARVVHSRVDNFLDRLRRILYGVSRTLKFLSPGISHYLTERITFITFCAFLSFSLLLTFKSLEIPRKFTRTVGATLLQKSLILEIMRTTN